MPRPTSLTPETHMSLVRAIKTGITRKAAAHIAGISDRTLRAWCERGATDEEPFASFAQDLLEAEASVEQAMTATVMRAAVKEGDWKAAQFWLERRSPEWRPKSGVDVNAKVTGVSLDDIQGISAAIEDNQCSPETPE